MNDAHLVNFEFECVDLPDGTTPNRAGLRLGIQDKQQIKQDVSGTARSARFVFPLTVTINPDTIVFTGNFAHGTRDNRFVYLSWGQWASPSEWKINSRVKVLLNGISRALVQSALQTHKPIRACIKLTNNKGQPNVASLKSEYIEWSV